MSLNKYRRKNNPLKPKRNFKDYIKFLAVAVLILFLLDFVIFKGERPYVKKLKQDYYAEKAQKIKEQGKAIEEALPPKVVFPDDGSEYFESPELKLKDEQSLLPEKEFKMTKLLPEIESTPPKEPQKLKVKKITGKRAKIAIVIDDVGMNIKQSRAAIDLPSEVTLAMLPYAKTVRDLAHDAKQKGHELIIHTPMEAMSKDVPLGSMALYDDMDRSAFQAEFNKIANSFDGYVGINNHMGSRLTQNPQAMGMLMEQLKQRGLFFLDSKTIGSSVAASTAEQYDVPNATRDVFLDHEDTPAFLQKALKNTERVARNYGAVIAIGHPKGVTMSALRQWIPTLEKRGFDLVPLSALIKHPQKPVVKEAKQEEGMIEEIQTIEPATGEATAMPQSLAPEPLNFDIPTQKIEMVKEDRSSISYPVE